jgi:hypothetical protein
MRPFYVGLPNVSYHPLYEPFLAGGRVYKPHLFAPFCEQGIVDEFLTLAPTRQWAPGSWCRPVAEHLLQGGFTQTGLGRGLPRPGPGNQRHPAPGRASYGSRPLRY